MQKTLKKTVIAILAVVMLLSLLPISVAAADEASWSSTDCNNGFFTDGYAASKGALYKVEVTLSSISSGGKIKITPCSKDGTTTYASGKTVSATGTYSFRVSCSANTMVYLHIENQNSPKNVKTSGSWKVYPKWTITFSSGSGEGNVFTKTAFNGEPFTFPTKGDTENYGFKKDGYHLVGWSTDSNDPSPSSNLGKTYSSINISSDRTYYAIWKPHTYGDWITEVEATCMEDGLEYRVCSRSDCGDRQEHTIPKISCNYDKEVIDPSCTEMSYTIYTCTMCGKIHYGNYLPALGHDWDVEMVEPTCTMWGYTLYTCIRDGCGYSEKRNLEPPLGHDLETVPPTCTEDGYTYCKRDGCDYWEDGEKALGHDLETVPPTCTEDGYTYCKRDVCDYWEDGEKALGHDIKEAKVDATCTAKGSITKTCSRCDYKEVTEIAALGHDYKDGVCTRCNAKKVCDGGDTCPSKNFTDKPAANNWAHAGIDFCVRNGLMNGVSNTQFDISGNVTRGQLVTILYRMADSPAVTSTAKFTDVGAKRYYTTAVAWAAEKKYVEGFAGNVFKPDDAITREQIATILYRYAGQPKVTGSIYAFPDAKDVHSYAKDAMIWATSTGLIQDITSNGVTTLSPLANATRAQIATIIMRYLKVEH